MTNDIRQGLSISPYLFNIFVDDLNIQLSEAKLGCFFWEGEEALNNFSYVDDRKLLAPFALGLTSLVIIRKRFVDGNSVQFCAPKSVVLLISFPACKLRNRPNVYLGDNVLSYVEEFRYSGHVICESCTGDKDIDREGRALATSSNLIIYRLKYCSEYV